MHVKHPVRPSYPMHSRTRTPRAWIGFVSAFSIVAVALSVLAEEQSVHVSEARETRHGWLTHSVKSPFQRGQTEIRVLLPDGFAPKCKSPVLFILPVEPGTQTRYGDGLLEIQNRDLHNRHQLICVAPTFSDWPWYADNQSQPQIRQEAYLLQVVVPFVDRTYPVAERRWLLGFSKSGWGAWTLLLRHPEVFDRAAAWDAPLMMERFGRYQSRDIFGTQANFERYEPARLVRADAASWRTERRLILLGYGNFRDHHRRMHSVLDELKIPHVYHDGPQRKHDWHSGWVAEAVDALAQDQRPSQPEADSSRFERR